MNSKQSIGFIGAGNMAEALIRGLRAGPSSDQMLSAFDPDKDRLRSLHTAHGILMASNNEELVTSCNVVILAVKPSVVPKILDDLGSQISPDTLIISVAAGVPIAAIQQRITAQTGIIRAMPNTPALVGSGVTALASGPFARPSDMTLATGIFNCVGSTVVVPERLINGVTGLSGSGPAYVFLILEALSDAGVAVGLSREQARQLSLHTVLGAAELVKQSGEHPSILKERVTSPGGTTIAGLQALEEGGLRATLIRAVQRATERATELGKQTTDS